MIKIIIISGILALCGCSYTGMGYQSTDLYNIERHQRTQSNLIRYNTFKMPEPAADWYESHEGSLYEKYR